MKRVINKFIVIILSATFLFSGVKIVNYYYEAYKQKELFDNVENKINKKVNGKTDVKGKTVQNKYLKLLHLWNTFYRRKLYNRYFCV